MKYSLIMITSICFIFVLACGTDKNKKENYQITVWQVDEFGLDSSKIVDESGKDTEKKSKKICDETISCGNVCAKLNAIDQNISIRFECKWDNDVLKSSLAKCVCP